MVEEKLYEYSVVFILVKKAHDFRYAGRPMVTVPEGVTGYVLDPRVVAVCVAGLDEYAFVYSSDSLVKVKPGDVAVEKGAALQLNRVAQFKTEYSWGANAYQMNWADAVRARKGQLCVVTSRLNDKEVIVHLEGGAFMPCPAHFLQPVYVP